MKSPSLKRHRIRNCTTSHRRLPYAALYRQIAPRGEKSIKNCF